MKSPRRCAVIEQRPGVATTMSTPALERAFLRLHRHAAVDGDAGQVRVVREALDVVVDLHASSRVGARISARVLPRRPDRGSRLQEAVEDRQHERGRLAGAGVGAANHVRATERNRDHRALNRGRRSKPRCRDALEERRVRPSDSNGTGAGS